MTVAYVSSSSLAQAQRTSSTCPAPASIVNGDALLAFLAVTPSANTTPPVITPPAGFTQAPGTWPVTITDSSAFNQTSYWIWKKIAASESGSYLFTHTGSANVFTTVGMICSSGNDTATPIMASAGQFSQNSGNSTTTTFLSIDTTGVPSALVVAASMDNNDSGLTLTPPTGSTPTFTSRINIGGLFVATGTLATAGATSNKTMTNNSATGESWGGFMLAIQPPVVVGGPPVAGFFL